MLPQELRDDISLIAGTTKVCVALLVGECIIETVTRRSRTRALERLERFMQSDFAVRNGMVYLTTDLRPYPMSTRRYVISEKWMGV